MDNDVRKERNAVWFCAAGLAVAASLPYLWALFLNPSGFSFLGFTHNIDDGAVYLSWINQVAHGKLFATNLYTPEAHAAQFNLLFVLIGWVCAITRVSGVVVFHIFRILLAFAVVMYGWRFSRQFLQEWKERILFVQLLGFSSGLGWLIRGGEIPNAPVDTWQPEAITFLSAYLNPLFLAGLLLTMVALDNLLSAVRTFKIRYALYAGVALLLLGNVHTYDVLTIAAVWLLYIVVLGMRLRRFPGKEIGMSLIAALMAVPSLAYQFYSFTSDPAFAARVNSPAPSPTIWFYFIGYGLVLAAAVVGAWRFGRVKSPNVDPWLLLIYAWAVIGFIMPYIPAAQQRKLVMGLHIPLCILAAYGIGPLFARLKEHAFNVAVCGLVLVMSVSNWMFMANDSRLLENGRTVTHYPPYARTAEFSAMTELQRVSEPTSVIYATPELALWIPVYSGLRVYYGHWSETPDYAGKLGRFLEFRDESTRDITRDQIVTESGADFLVFDSNRYPVSDSLRSYFDRRLKQVWESGGVAIYRVNGGQSAVGGQDR